MKKVLLLSVVFTFGCEDFAQLGIDARCAAAKCDAGVLDAGAPDAGTDDAGTNDANTADASVQVGPLVVQWSSTAPAPTAFFLPRPGTVVPGGPGRTVLMRELSLVQATNELPAGFIVGEALELETATGHEVDAGIDGGSTRGFIPGERYSVTSRGGLEFLTVRETLVDGGTPPAPPPDGGRGTWILGDIIIALARDGLEVQGVASASPIPLAAGGFNETDGGFVVGLIDHGPLRSSLSVVRNGVITPVGDGVGCTERVHDSVMTLDRADDRIVTLSECGTPDGLYVASYSPRPGVNTSVRKAIAPGATNGRMAIAPESFANRAPIVAFQDAATKNFSLARMNAGGTDFAGQSPRQIVDQAPNNARIEAVAVDGSGNTLVVFSASRLHFINHPFIDSTPTRLILASFDESLALRWASALQGPDPLKCNSATFSEGQLVLELQCPNAMNTVIAPGGICKKDLWSIAAKVALPDGGLP